MPSHPSVSQSNSDMVKARLLEAQYRVGQDEPGEKDGDTHFLLNGHWFVENDHLHSGGTPHIEDARYKRDT